LADSAKHRRSLHADGDADLEGEPIVQVTIASRPDELRLVRSTVSEAAAICGCSEECVQDIVIAVDEACQNVIKHAYGGDPNGEVVIDVRRDGDRIAINIVDYAPPVDESTVRPRALDELRPGGLGTHFIAECMDDARFRSPPAGAGNRLWMIKRIK
jgi:sigma-B regulation protein RsbU (phosphoserine phosphatase)